MAHSGGRWGLSILVGAVALVGAAPASAAVTSVSVGQDHSCAVKTTGAVVCWGSNAKNQTTTTEIGDVSELQSGGLHTCAVKADGTPVCWGDDSVGQATIPAGVGTVAHIAAGLAHTCAIETDGTPICWGYDSDGQTAIPTGAEHVTQITVGGFHTCAILPGGAPKCWGWNLLAQSTIPSAVTAVTQVSAGLEHTCAIESDGTPVCWGDDSAGQSTVPTDIGHVSQVSAGAFHTCAIKADGTAVCWGDNGNGQRTVPPGLGTVKAISAGFTHTCAVTTGGAVVCWGKDEFGKLGQAPALSAPAAHASNEPYAYAVQDGTFPATLSVTAGALPPGLALAGGQITGTPTATGVYAGTLSASDGVFAAATQPFSISVDVSAPLTTDNVPAGPVNHAVTVTLSAADTGWGGVTQTYYAIGGAPPVAYDPAHKPVLHDGETIRYHSTDGAGNTEPTKTSRAARVDTKAPTVSITSPVAGATYVKGARVLAAYACSDACTGAVPRGAAVDTRAAGRHTFAVTARDAAGNVTRRTVAYTVSEPPDTTGPVVTIPATNKTLKVRSQAVVFKLGPALEPTDGTVALTARSVTLGSAGFAAGTGQAAAVKIKLSSKAKKALKMHKRLKAKALVTVRDATGNATVMTFRLTIKR